MFNITGLNNNEVTLSRNKNGTNEITEGKKRTIFSLILESLNDPIIKILLIALAVKILFFLNDSDIYETIGIIVAIILATVISSMSEYGSEKAFQKLSSTTSNLLVKVIRNKKLIEVPLNDIVVGDYIYLESGDKVPADGIMYKESVYIDESMLTGETKEQYKDINKKVYRGSIVLHGRGIMLVKSVGNNTYYGKIAKDIQERTPDSPLKNRLKDLAGLISKIGYICAGLVIISYLFSAIVIKNNFNLDKIISTVTNLDIILPHLLYSLTLGITIIVVAVPEGLPMMITLVLSSNMKKLVKENVLVRKLVGIESSGSLNILFTDKTGTLTKGKLEMVNFTTYSGTQYKKYNDIPISLKEIISLSLNYNNDSSYSSKDIIGGNTTDRAILKFIGEESRDKYKIIRKTEFNSKLKYSTVTLNYNGELTFYKGAYELISNKCKFYYKDNGVKGILKDKKSLIDEGNKYTKNGYRVLACACGKDSDGLTFIGFILIKDEVRPEIPKAIADVKKAGIQTVMITGDNKLTAESIAREIKLVETEEDLIITSEELSKMNDIEVKNILPKLRVVARSLPEDKKRLVLLSQELGLVTGMTGDGVNDAPALKRADVGFAMGSGTEVAKEVSDIIILDDNFLGIVKTILFGRTLFKSIRKFIIFQLTVNITAVSLSVIGPLFGIIAPVTVVQMLWINMVMDTLAGVAYACEPPLESYMEENPKKRDEKIMNSYMINEILVTGLYMSSLCMIFLKSDFLHSLYRVGENDKYVMTAFFGLFIFMTIFNAFNARSHRLNIFANLRKNKVFLAIISFVLIVQLLMIYFGGSIFRTTGLSFIELNLTILLALTVIPFDFLRKTILKKLGKNIGV